MLSLGPIIFGLFLGLIIGSQIKLNIGDVKFTVASFIVIIIVGFIISWQLGQYPFYTDLPISTGFSSALIGVVVGKLLFSWRK